MCLGGKFPKRGEGQEKTGHPFGCPVVREAGVEPARPCEHWHLKPASLPIPPLAHLVVERCCSAQDVYYHRSPSMSTTFCEKNKKICRFGKRRKSRPHSGYTRWGLLIYREGISRRRRPAWPCPDPHGLAGRRPAHGRWSARRPGCRTRCSGVAGGRGGTGAAGTSRHRGPCPD